MSYTFENNTITVNVTSGITVCTLIDDEDKYNWEEGFIKLSDLGILKSYKVYISAHKFYSIIIKPRERYECRVFEDLFDFESHCEDYSETKIIGIKDKWSNKFEIPLD